MPTGADVQMWVRVGGGMESVPDRTRYGPADPAFPPPGGPWQALALNGRLVGWAEHGGLAAARRSAELGQRFVEEQRDHLVSRLGHKLRSAVLALQESTRQAAFGRPDMLETVFEQAQEVGRRAAALEAASAVPKERARSVVLGAVLSHVLPAAHRTFPADAAVIGSEPALVEVFTRIRDWLAGDAFTVGAEAVGSWWKVSVCAEGVQTPLAVPEMGEPLIRLIVDTHLDGWLDASRPGCADVYLPAHAPR